MSNQLKLLVMKQKQKKIKTKKIFSVDHFIQDIRTKEMDKLKNPIKGQLFVHLDESEDYYFFQYDGKKWIEIK